MMTRDELLPSPMPPIDDDPVVWIVTTHDRPPDPEHDPKWANLEPEWAKPKKLKCPWPTRQDEDTGEWYIGIPPSFVRHLTVKFAPLDPLDSIEHAASWSEDALPQAGKVRAKRRKTYDGMPRFLENWCRREHKRLVENAGRLGISASHLESAEHYRECYRAKPGSHEKSSALAYANIPRSRWIEWGLGDTRSMMFEASFAHFVSVDGQWPPHHQSARPDEVRLYSLYGRLDQQYGYEGEQWVYPADGEEHVPFANRVVEEGWPLMLRESRWNRDFAWWCKDEAETLVGDVLDAAGG
jgi:hypothetical protein